jgi:hypothetical protein
LKLLQLLYDKGFRFKLETEGHRVINNLAEQRFNEGDVSYCNNCITYSVVVEWLRVNHGIWVSVGVGNLFHEDKFFILIKKYNIDRWELTPLDNERHSPYDTPQQAYSAAFDYILNNLI